MRIAALRKLVLRVATAVAALLAICWIANAWKLFNCDFRPDYRCEAIHAVGLVPVLSPIAVWFATDESAQ